MNRPVWMLLPATIVAALIGGSAVGAAQPSQSPVEICAATSIAEVDGLLADVADADLTEGLAPLVDLTVPEDQGLVLEAEVSLDDVRDALGCDNTPTTSTTPSVPAPGDERDCSDFDNQTNAQGYYNTVSTPGNPDPSRLDADGDQVACEEFFDSDSGSGVVDPTRDDGTVVDPENTQVDIIPEGSVDTGAP